MEKLSQFTISGKNYPSDSLLEKTVKYLMEVLASGGIDGKRKQSYFNNWLRIFYINNIKIAQPLMFWIDNSYLCLKAKVLAKFRTLPSRRLLVPQTGRCLVLCHQDVAMIALPAVVH